MVTWGSFLPSESPLIKGIEKSPDSGHLSGVNPGAGKHLVEINVIQAD